jgi:hypothetical protein
MIKKKWMILPLGALVGPALLLPSFAPRLLWGEEAVSLPTTVHVGDVVAIPDFTFPDGSVATKSVKTPKGGLFAGSSFKVDSIGAYSVIYSSGQQKEVKKVLAVRTASDLFKNNGKASVSHGSFSLKPTLVGTMATFENGGSLVYQKSLTLTGASKADPFLSFIVEPLSSGESAINDFTLTLSDNANSLNALTITFVDSGPINCNGEGCYVKAGASGQRIGGWEGKKFLTDSIYGCPAASSFRGLGDPKELTLYYDDSEKALYLNQGWGAAPESKTLVADFDSLASFSTLWGGWTSGKVTASFSAGDVHSTSASILITSLGGEAFTAEDYPDLTAPKITLDQAGETSLPSAVLGREYPLWDGSAVDDFEGEVALSRQVYFLDPSSKKQLPIATYLNDNHHLCFVPAFVGNYQLIYQASDLSANENRLVLTLPSYQSKSSIRLNLVTGDSEASVYSTIAVDNPTAITSVGGEGSVRISRTLLDPEGNEVAVKDNQFVPEKVGVYTCRYVGTDYLGYKGAAERKITVKNLTHVSFIGTIALPRILIKGFTYCVPTARAKAADGADKTKDATIEVLLNDAALTGSSFVASGTSVKLSYVAKDGTDSERQDYPLAVVDGQNGKDQAAYFVGDLSASESKENLDLLAEKDGMSCFANPLNADDFSLGFAYEEGKRNFSELALRLVDSADATNSLTFKIASSLSGAQISYPGSTGTSSFPMNALQLGFNYHNSSKSFSGIDEETIAQVSVNDAGMQFVGFSGSVYLEIALTNVTSSSLIHLSKLNNQTLGFRASSLENARDSIAPVIYSDNAEAVKQELGAKITLLSARSYDVLSDIASFLVNVTSPDQKALLTNEDARLEHTFALDLYGVYTVTYVAIDGAGNKKSFTRLYRVDESEKPVLTVKNTLSSTYALGATLALPEYSVADNSGSYHLDVYLKLPDGERWLLLTNSDGTETSYLSEDNSLLPSGFLVDQHSFKLLEKGAYSLQFFAYDSYFNYVNEVVSFAVE